MAISTKGWRAVIAEGRGLRLVVILLGVWLMAADSLVTATIMPSVGADLDAFQWLGWAISAFYVAAVVASASAGWLSLRIGLRRAMVLAGILMAAGCLLSTIGGITGFLAGRIVQGIAAGWILGLCYVTIGVIFPQQHLPRVFALTTSVWGIATFVGPLFGGAFADAGEWRGVFWLFAVQAVAFALAAGFLVPARDASSTVGAIPFRTLMLLTAGVVTLAAAGVVTSLGTAIVLIASGVALLAATLCVDARASVPLLPRTTANLGTPLGAAYATYFTTTAGAVAFAVYGPAMLQFTAGISAMEAGYLVAIEAIAWTAAALCVSGARPPWDRRFIVIGAGSTAAGSVILVAVMATDRLVVIGLAGALLGAGFGLAYSFIGQRVMACLGDDERELGSGAIGAVRSAGGAVGAAFAGIAANAAGFGDGPNARNIAASAILIFGIGVPFTLAGLAMSARLARLSRTVSPVPIAA